MTLTVAELAAFLGMTPSGLRNVISRKQITAVGKRGKANLYRPSDVLRHAGARDRRLAGSVPESVGH